MDPITLALISLGIQVGGSLLDNLFFDLDLFGEKTAQREQEALVKEQADLQIEQIGRERTAAEVSFQEQQDVFAEQARSFQGSQKQAINMAGVSLTQGSPLMAQQQTIENIAKDKAALTRNQEVSLSQFDVAEVQVNTAYQQYLLSLEQRDRDRELRPFRTLLGGVNNSPIASLIGTEFGTNTSKRASTKTSIKPVKNLNSLGF